MGMVLYLKQLEVGLMQNFIYLVGDTESKECLMVDPAWDVSKAMKAAESDGMKVVGGLLTHSHYDHANGVEELIKKTKGKLYVHENEAKVFTDLGNHVVTTKNGDKIQIGKIELTCLHTPGHTPGAQCFLVEGRLISGDTLFVGACGRCDLPGGSEKQMAESLRRLAALPEETIVFPGHDYGDTPTSTIGYEKRNNPCL